MMEIIRERESGVAVSHVLFFADVCFEGSGFAFDCDENGVVDESKLHPIGKDSLAGCRRGNVGSRVVHPGVVERRETRYAIPAVGRCNACHRAVTLYGTTNECECGALYNIAGQRLAPRHLWGEETGEHWSEIP